MPRKGASFVQSDLSRALRACRDADVLDLVQVRVERGKGGDIVIMPLGAKGAFSVVDDPPVEEHLPDLPDI
ncbi:MAG: hypothetical protein IAE97_14175 [Chthoniobacterales bacterium]|nr:hypothetical protein [Chthoniobacterales bacterium]